MPITLPRTSKFFNQLYLLLVRNLTAYENAILTARKIPQELIIEIERLAKPFFRS